MEIESGSAIAFVDVLVISEEATIATKVYRKPTQASTLTKRIFSSEVPE
jgi:hypothetical protein